MSHSSFFNLCNTIYFNFCLRNPFDLGLGGGTNTYCVVLLRANKEISNFERVLRAPPPSAGICNIQTEISTDGFSFPHLQGVNPSAVIQALFSNL